MTRKLILALTYWVAFMAAHAWGQTVAPNRIEVVQHVASACPGLIRDSHAFTDAVFSLLNRDDPRWGRNGKRGNANDLSDDAGAYLNEASTLVGSDGRRLNIIDIIGAAGSPAASPAWIDQTQATIDGRTTGVWVKPSGVLPACLSGGSTPTVPPVVTPQPPAQSVDLTPVLDAIAALRLEVAELKARQTDVSLFTRYVQDMTGDGPDGDGPLPPHVTDIKQRLDVLRIDVEQLTAWLRARPLLRP